MAAAIGDDGFMGEALEGPVPSERSKAKNDHRPAPLSIRPAVPAKASKVLAFPAGPGEDD
jgi:hypothetical protein